uniref:Uncharacterized protein n=1 Tax=Nelumbo nucifera TaxID=4432 RepID=A0A822Z7I4_NELNU|nr:TPA_asm: hypothetical protein HUJ06_014825 [Nelumbo nucifera]
MTNPKKWENHVAVPINHNQVHHGYIPSVNNWIRPSWRRKTQLAVIRFHCVILEVPEQLFSTERDACMAQKDFAVSWAKNTTDHSLEKWLADNGPLYIVTKSHCVGILRGNALRPVIHYVQGKDDIFV